MKKLHKPSPELEITQRPLLVDVVADRVEHLIGAEWKISAKDRATLYMSHFQWKDTDAIIQELQKKENSIVKRRSLIHILVSRFEHEQKTLFPFLADFYWQENRLEIAQEIMTCFLRNKILENKKTRNAFCRKWANETILWDEKNFEKFILLGDILAPYSCEWDSFMILDEIAQKQAHHEFLYRSYLRVFSKWMENFTTRQLLRSAEQMLGLWSQCYRHAL